MTADEKPGAAAQRRWLAAHKLLAAALLLALLLIWFTDATAVAPVHLLDYFGPVSASNATPEPTWISAPSPPNFTATLLSRWLSPGAAASRTAAISVPALDGAGGVHLAAGEAHEFAIQALDEAGAPRTHGGDYFETDLSGESWKSRPPVADHGNGSYTVTIQMHPNFTGDYNFTIVLLFRGFEGLKFSPSRFAISRELRRFRLRFSHSNASSLPPLQGCSGSSFGRGAWSGRWTRHAKNDSCGVDDDGRYRCLAPDLPCSRPWCEGPLGALESNGWVYSAHCSFKIFGKDSAWRCLNKKWLFFWGDSNHVDTIRNLLIFVLGISDVESVPRRFDREFKNPSNGSESVRITSVFNGHWNETQNYLGLDSLRNGEFRGLLWRYFEETRSPDAMVLNSGLHDGVHWRSIRAFADAAEYAAQFWGYAMKHLEEKGKPRPRVFYRTTIATGGYARELAFNPSKMEAFNGVMVEKLGAKGLLTGGVVDEFDMTFPWHYDNRCNDGVHYGRAPAKRRWRDGEVGHQYFVDLMLAHVLLNAVCGAG